METSSGSNPPLPPPLPITIDQKFIQRLVKPRLIQNDRGDEREVVRDLLRIRRLYEQSDPDLMYLSIYNQAPSILQDGPMCGLVAAHIAIESIGISVASSHHLLKLAKERGYTHQGEMFSTEQLGKLIEEEFPVKATVVRGFGEEKSKRINEILNHLSRGWPILIAYDSDFNHTPCLKGGQKAHWAVLLGICLTLKPSTSLLEDIHKFTDQDPVFHQLRHIRRNSEFLFDPLTGIMNNIKIEVYAKQGKSTFLQCFSIDSLIESNLNLFECDLSNRGNYVIPKEGVARGLSNQALLIKPNQNS
ncbi:actin maturation protease [Brevipalpus obovatus]|uniref:actin maturation protease n=1 Tax=Brevipalpus obovatus TaxID=246614 RepID=UPI003D9DB22F